MDFVPPLTEEEASYWAQVLDRLSKDERTGVENLPPEVPKLFTLGVMRTFPKAKGDKLVKLVLKAIRKHLIWWEKNDMDRFLESSFSKARIYRDHVWPIKFCGTDPEGFGILVARLKDTDWSLAQKKIPNKEEMLSYFIFNTEILKLFLKGKKMPYRCNMVFDFQGMKWGDYLQAWRLGIKRLFTELADHNPETVKTISLINVPTFFSMCYKTVTPFIPHDTVAKVTILSHKPSQDHILQHFQKKGFESLQDYPKCYENGEFVITEEVVLLEEQDDSSQGEGEKTQSIKQLFGVE